MGPARYLAARLSIAALTLFGISIIVFLAIHLVPGSYEEIYLGPTATPAEQAALREHYGLDKPLPEQYVRWLSSIVGGNFGLTKNVNASTLGGYSLATQRPVSDEFARRAPVTLELALIAVPLSMLLGVSLGGAAALTTGSRFARGVSRIAASLAISTPEFVVGSVLLYLFSRYSLGLTVGDYVPFFDDPVRNLRAMALPIATLSTFASALVMRTTRDAALAVLTEPYVTAAVARGESPARIVWQHVVRNAAIPVVTVVAANAGYLLGGAVIVETLFTLPGFGSYVATAISTRDYAVVQTGVLLSGAAFIGISLLADLLYLAIDPRVQLRGRQR